MDKFIEQFLSFGIEISKNPNEALVYDVSDKNGVMLSGRQFKQIYQAFLKAPTGKDNPSVRVLADGDSWIDILWPLSALFGYERTFFDIIQAGRKIHTKEFAFPGDRFEDILAGKEYITDLKSATYQYFVFSGGGNDVLGGGALRRFLKDREATDPMKPAETWFDMKRIENAFQKISNGYEQLAKETKTYASGKTDLLIHGYDYPIPRSGEPWLGEPLEDRGYDLKKDAVQIAAIFVFLVDSLYDLLARVARKHSCVQVIDLRNIVGSRWNDELHPKTNASQEIAKQFIDEMAINSDAA